jgi:hypothetical protein
VVNDSLSDDTLAARQLRAAWNDPRLGRGPGAHVADFFDYLQEADRILMLATRAISDMQDAMAREAARLGLDPGLKGLMADQQAALQAARERAELATAEVHNQHPHLRALTLIGVYGNLDGLVESLTPEVHKMLAPAVARAVMDRVRNDPALAEDVAALPAGSIDAVREALTQVLADRSPPKPRPRKGESGAERWEARLRTVGLGAPPDRPIPPSLGDALGELSALRDVVVHRAGRVDERALTKWPRLTQLGLGVGDFVRIDRRLYRRYAAAVRSYGSEVVRRLLGDSVPAVAVDLKRWESYAPLME